MGLEWLRRRLSMDRDGPVSLGESEAREGRAVSGKYFPLYDYLNRRYARVVVLTVAEIEDILGFTLPDAARLHEGWWATPGQGAAVSRHDEAWRLARRTARPNLVALTVVFERPD